MSTRKPCACVSMTIVCIQHKQLWAFWLYWVLNCVCAFFSIESFHAKSQWLHQSEIIYFLRVNGFCENHRTWNLEACNYIEGSQRNVSLTSHFVEISSLKVYAVTIFIGLVNSFPHRLIVDSARTFSYTNSLYLRITAWISFSIFQIRNSTCFSNLITTSISYRLL